MVVTSDQESKHNIWNVMSGACVHSMNHFSPFFIHFMKADGVLAIHKSKGSKPNPKTPNLQSLLEPKQDKSR